MIKLMSLEVYNSIFSLTDENNKFKLHPDNFDEFPFQEIKGELDEILCFSNFSRSHLQHEKKGPRIIQAYKK